VACFIGINIPSCVALHCVWIDT